MSCITLFLIYCTPFDVGSNQTTPFKVSVKQMAYWTIYGAEKLIGLGFGISSDICPGVMIAQ